MNRIATAMTALRCPRSTAPSSCPLVGPPPGLSPTRDRLPPRLAQWGAILDSKAAPLGHGLSADQVKGGVAD
jgi:hypothetical protein